MMVALLDVVKLAWIIGGFDLNAVIVIPLLVVDKGEEETLVDFSATVVEGTGSIIKGLLLDATDVGVWFPFEEGITCNDDPIVVTTFIVGGVEIIPELLWCSGMKPLKLAKISATFLRSTWVGLAVPLICPVMDPPSACLRTLPEATADTVP